MRSLILGLSLLLAATRASGAQPVTTGDTDFPDHSVVIVSPEDGAVFEGSPEAIIPVTIEIEYFNPVHVELLINNADSITCPEEPPCELEVTLPPGVHELWAVGDDGGLRADHKINVEVKATTTEGPTSGGASDTDTGNEPTTNDTEPAVTDTDSDTGASDGADGDGGKKGCACSAGVGAPDLLGLALFALVVPWRRLRRA